MFAGEVIVRSGIPIYLHGFECRVALSHGKHAALNFPSQLRWVGARRG